MVMTRTCPSGSARRLLAALESGTRSAVIEMATSPTGMLAQKMPRQPTVPTRMPPMTGPSAMDRPDTPSQTPMALARSDGVVNVLVMMPSAAGLSIEPPTPCSTRKAISQLRLGASEHSQEPRVNRLRPTWKMVLRPIRSAAAPENISRDASTIVYTGHRPLQPGDRGVQRLADLGQAHVHDRVVQPDHEKRGTADAEHHRAAAGTDGHGK